MAAPVATNGGAKSISFTMDKEMILKIISAVGGVLFLLALFVPYLRTKGYFSISHSFWDEENQLFFKLFWIILGIVPILSLFLPKAKKFSYLTAGWGLCILIQACGSPESFGEIGDWIKSLFEYRFLGWYFLILGTLAIFIANLIEDIPAMFKKDNAAKTTAVATAVATNSSVTNVNVILNNPQSGAVCKNCGQPRTNLQEEVCPKCGKRYE